MSVRTTNFGPRVSFTTTLADAGPVHVLVPSTGTLEAAGTNTFSGTNTLSGTNTFSGAVTASGGLKIGAGGVNLSTLSSSVISVNLPSIAGSDSGSTTATINTLTADSIVLALQPTSIWSGAYLDLTLGTQVSAASSLVVSAANSAVTAVDPDNQNMTVVWFDPA
jgi:hypothetical protein